MVAVVAGRRVFGLRRSDPSSLAKSGRLLGLWRLMGAECAWAVGGAVRDILLGLPVGDVDLAVEGTLEENGELAKRLARALGGHAHVLGREPRAVWQIEGRALKVELWPLGELTLEADARRRDFTVNAMLWRLPRGPLVDPVGGLDDLSRGRLRAVSRENLQSDPVRLLRASRFAAQLPGFRVEGQTLDWLRKLSPLLGEAPRERLGQEIEHLLEARDPARGWNLMAATGQIEAVAPPGTRLRPGATRRGDGLLARLSGRAEHPLPQALRRQGAEARLGLLMFAWGPPSDSEITAYAWPRTTRRRALTAASLAEEAVDAALGEWPARRRLIHRAGEATPAVLALAAGLDTEGRADRWGRFWCQWLRRGSELVDPVPMVSADEVAKRLGLEPGPELGLALRTLVEAQVSGRVRSRAEALRFVDRRPWDVVDSEW